MITFSGTTESMGGNSYILHDDGGNPAPIAPPVVTWQGQPVRVSSPIWSPDGKRMLYTVTNLQTSASTVHIADFGAGQIQPIEGPSAFTQGSAWLNDGRILCKCMMRDSGSVRSVSYTMQADGTDQRTLAQYDEYKRATISPDGQQLVMLRQGNSAVVIRRLQDSQEHVIVEGTRGERNAIDWSPDGKRVAFTEAKSRYAGAVKEDVYVVEADGSNLHKIGQVVSESNFAWSPDGERIAGVSPHARAHQHVFTIDVMEVNSSRQIPLAEARRNRQSGIYSPPLPAWSPDGRQLLYGTYDDPHEILCVVSLENKKVECVVGSEQKFTDLRSLGWKMDIPLMKLADASLETQALLAAQMPRLESEQERETRDKIFETIRSNLKAPAWTGFRRALPSAPLSDWHPAVALSRIVPKPEEEAWFVPVTPFVSSWPIFSARSETIEQAAGKYRLFEYHVIAKDFSWAIGKNAHDEIFVRGKAVEKRGEALNADRTLGG